MRPLVMLRRGLGRLARTYAHPHAELADLPAEHVSVVTGASSGIGFETALGLARAGSTVVIVGRNPERTEACAQRIRDAAGHDRVSAELADFSELAQVSGLAARLLTRTERIDVLVNNAGLWHHDKRLTADGFEESLGVNHLAPFLLTRLLHERLEASAGRVVTVSSRLHTTARGVSIDDPAWERRPYRGLEAYAESKLANVLFAKALARRFERATSTAVHPGDVATDVTRDSVLLSAGMAIVRGMLLTPEEGAQTSLYAAASDGAAGETGVYYAECAAADPSPLADEVEFQERLWAWSEDAVGV